MKNWVANLVSNLPFINSDEAHLQRLKWETAAVPKIDVVFK